MSLYFADQSWPQLEAAIAGNALILLPLGQTEEHGPHLPVSTDAVQVSALAKGIAKELQDEIPALVMPTIWAGYSMQEMARWPGTITVRPRVLIDYLFDICASLIEMGFTKIILLDGHGNHHGLLRVVTREIADKYGVYMAVTKGMAAERYREIARAEYPPGNMHGGERETSQMLYLEQPVDMDLATKKDILRFRSKFRESGAVYWSTWGVQKSKAGLIGDPTVGTRETGKALMEAKIRNCAAFAREFFSHQREE